MNDEDLKKNINDSLDAYTGGINAASQQQLNEIRKAALKRRSLIPMWSMAGAFAAITLVVLLFINDHQQVNQSPENNIAMFEDLELLAGEADAEFYQDLEFLNWLDANNLLDSEI